MCIRDRYRVLQEIKKWEKILKIPISVPDDDRFFCSIDEFEKWADNKKELKMETFYQMMRKKHHVLIDENGKPKGGKWNYDVKNRKRLPKNHPKIPNILEHKPDKITNQVITDVKKKFSKHFGKLEPFWFATTHEDAVKSLNEFVKNRLETFGPYEDAMAQNEKFLYHSVLSLSLIHISEPTRPY